jgi:hypothetical protein
MAFSAASAYNRNIGVKRWPSSFGGYLRQRDKVALALLIAESYWCSRGVATSAT